MRRGRFGKQALGNEGLAFGLGEQPGTQGKEIAMGNTTQDDAISINGTGWSPTAEAQWLAQPSRVLRQQTSMQPNWRAVFPEKQPEKCALLNDGQQQMSEPRST